MCSDQGDQIVNPKGNQSWIFIGRTDAEAEEAPIPWPPDAKSQLIRKDPDAGKDLRQEKRVIENEMVEWHHSMAMRLSKLQEIVEGREALHAEVHGVAVGHGWVTELNLKQRHWGSVR